MGYPTFEYLDLNVASADVATLFNLIGNSIHQIFEGETIYERADFNKKELKTFLESLTSDQFVKLRRVDQYHRQDKSYAPYESKIHQEKPY